MKVNDTIHGFRVVNVRHIEEIKADMNVGFHLMLNDLLADGKTRKLENPKRKKRKHTAFVMHSDCRVAEKIRSEEKVTNSELRRTLAEYGGDGNPDQEG